jgi:hypothetical protein
MLRCTIELIPFGKELEKRALSEILISNDGTGNTDIGNYRATVCENNQILTGRVENHARLEHGPAFRVARAIDACLMSKKEGE